MPPKESSRTYRSPCLTPGKKAPAPTPRASPSISTTIPTASILPIAQSIPLAEANQQHNERESTQPTSSQLASLNPSPQPSTNPKKMTCGWTDADDEVLINCLKDEKALHAGTTNGFKPVSWTQAAIALQGSEHVTGSKAKDASTCKSRWAALKKLYLSFKTVAAMSGAGWDETLKMISLPPSVWVELGNNKSAAGRDLSRWQTRALPLYHDLAFLIEGNTANGNLSMTTVDSPVDFEEDLSGDGNGNGDGDGDGDRNHEEYSDHESPVASKSTQGPSKRKQGSAMSPDAILGELRSMSSSFAKAMQTTIPPLAFPPLTAPPTVHMQAVTLVQNEEGLEDLQLFEAVDFLGQDNNAEIYISFNPVLRSTWLRMKMGW